MKNGFKVSAVIPAKPAEIYKAWLSSKGHSAMTGSTAKVTGKVGENSPPGMDISSAKRSNLNQTAASFKPGGHLNFPTTRLTPASKFYWSRPKPGQK